MSEITQIVEFFRNPKEAIQKKAMENILACTDEADEIVDEPLALTPWDPPIAEKNTIFPRAIAVGGYSYDDVQETFLERLCGMGEMFPPSFLSTAGHLFEGSKLVVRFLGRASWVLLSSSLVLFAPPAVTLMYFQWQASLAAENNRVLHSMTALLGPGARVTK